ncbi:MAG: carboxypeptidase regulatory-like domain-containing protein, partial [Deltaproteobacteria bacterium]|nr:carboxypeptidase regulatory-like domain-containing protein [Deltaproteobacteria bacterium]
MNRHKHLRILLIPCVATAICAQQVTRIDQASTWEANNSTTTTSTPTPELVAPDNGHAGRGSIRGVTRQSDGQALPAAEVTVRSETDKTEQTVVSGTDGTFLIADLKPGPYRLTAKAAGLATTSATTVDVVDQQVVSVDVPLSKNDSTAHNVSAAKKNGFFARFGRAYWNDWHPPAATTPAAPTSENAEPAYRGYPPPVSNPPFPFNV